MSQEDLISLGVAVAAAVWAWVQTTAWWRARQGAKHAEAIQFVEAAVNSVYDTYTRRVKQQNSTQRLSERERVTARNLAVEKAQVLAHKDGMDLDKRLGGVALRDLEIEKAVKRLKG